MGRGLSAHQKQILGLAYCVSKIHGQPHGRGELFRLSEGYHRAGLLAVRNAGFPDVTQPLAVHLVWGISLSATIDYDPIFYGGNRRFFRSGYTASNSGVFCNSDPAVKAAKVAATKALKRLVERELLAVRFNGLYSDGFVLTDTGSAIGEAVGMEIDDSIINEALGQSFNQEGRLALAKDWSR